MGFYYQTFLSLFTGNGSNGQVGMTFQCNTLHSIREFNIRQMQDIASYYITAVELQGCRNIFRQSYYFNSSIQQRNTTALQFNSLRSFRVNNVQGYTDAQWLGSINNLEVNMLNLLTERMHLEITHDNVLSFTV
ncbi:hypothetical protein AABM17_1405 [Neisseria musculi]|uniref:Uncharacterized protein n=1 Tax=Neisseria musculi TaxID=1815583 RepID=A0A7H1MBX0_9NEIS|nr:hypothetical protein H7A79_1405 [Neisseria musculi]